MNETTEALLETDEFNVYVPNVVDLVQKSGDPEENRLIGGFCSTEDLDRQGEIVVAKGLDFDEFRRYGYFNDNHKQETSSALGYPTLVELRKGRWYTEGNLIKEYPPADQIWLLAKALSKSDGPRRLGFSIEGKVLERDGGNRILKAKVRHVAITHSPVNTSCTWTTISKAFASPEAMDVASAKAVSLRGSVVPQRNDVAVAKAVREGEMTFDQAVVRLQKLRPDLSKSFHTMIVMTAMRMRG